MTSWDGDGDEGHDVDEEIADLLAETYGAEAYEDLMQVIKAHDGDTPTLLDGAWLGIRTAFHYVMASAVAVDDQVAMILDPNMSDHVLSGMYDILQANYPARRPPHDD
jgi:hypothetical protein